MPKILLGNDRGNPLRELNQLKDQVKEAVDAAKNYYEVLNVCEQFKEDQTPRKLREYNDAFNDGKKFADIKKKEFEKVRTTKATCTKKEQRAIKEKYVIDTYTKMINDKLEKAILEALSETKMAKRVKERVEEDLRKAKTSRHRSVLKSHVDNKRNVIVTGLSPRTIIRILRNRDKGKLHFYPWEEKGI
ncbi:MAG: hypothetical protein K4571_17640 [Deltaproteobacteria bacterium]